MRTDPTFDQLCDAEGDDARLAGAGSGEHEQRPAERSYGGALGAYGIQAYANGDAVVENVGTVAAVSGLGVAYGIGALSFAGDASVDNSGNVYAYGNAAAYGLLATASYGDATVVNSGLVVADGGYAFGASVSAYDDAVGAASALATTPPSAASLLLRRMG